MSAKARKGLLTQRAYARRKRVTPQYVSKLVRAGRIPLTDSGKIDPRKADAALAGARKRPWRSKIANPEASAPALSSAGERNASATTSLTAARATDQIYQARIRKLEYEKLVGTLVPAAEVLEAERRKNMNLRTRFRRLARVLAPRLVRAHTPAEMEELVLAEIDAQLAELAQDPLGLIPNDAAPVAAQPLATENLAAAVAQ